MMNYIQISELFIVYQREEGIFNWKDFKYNWGMDQRGLFLI